MDKAFIVGEIADAMRAHDKDRVSILRLVKNEIDTREKETGEALTDEQVVGALKKVLKQTTETLEYSRQAGTDPERTAILGRQVAVLEGYLPAQVTGEELRLLVERIVAEEGLTAKRDMGRAIGLVTAAAGGNVDKAEVARILGGMLS